MISYYKAAKRHYADGELLLNNNKQANAGQLFGFSAECSIKSLLVSNGYPCDLNGNIEKKTTVNFRVHVNVLARSMVEIQSFLSGRSGAKYLSMISCFMNFIDWNTDHRYYDETAIPPCIGNWRSAAQELLKTLDQALLDGEIMK